MQIKKKILTDKPIIQIHEYNNVILTQTQQTQYPTLIFMSKSKSSSPN